MPSVNVSTHSASTSKSKTKYYAVSIGRAPGIYNNWTEAGLQTNKYSCGTVQSCSTIKAAIDAMSKAGFSNPKLYTTKSSDIPESVLPNLSNSLTDNTVLSSTPFTTLSKTGDIISTPLSAWTLSNRSVNCRDIPNAQEIHKILATITDQLTDIKATLNAQAQQISSILGQQQKAEEFILQVCTRNNKFQSEASTLMSKMLENNIALQEKITTMDFLLDPSIKSKNNHSSQTYSTSTQTTKASATTQTTKTSHDNLNSNLKHPTSKATASSTSKAKASSKSKAVGRNSQATTSNVQSPHHDNNTSSSHMTSRHQPIPPQYETLVIGDTLLRTIHPSKDGSIAVRTFNNVTIRRLTDIVTDMPKCSSIKDVCLQVGIHDIKPDMTNNYVSSLADDYHLLIETVRSTFPKCYVTVCSLLPKKTDSNGRGNIVRLCSVKRSGKYVVNIHMFTILTYCLTLQLTIIVKILNTLNLMGSFLIKVAVSGCETL